MRNRRRENRISLDAENKDRWLISYADLVTLLLALFIVMYAASDDKRAAKVAESFAGQNNGGDGILPGQKKTENNNQKFGSTLLENPILVKNTNIRESKHRIVVSLSEAGFFAPGDASIDKQAQEVIAELAKTLSNNNAQIRIEGHTDSTPISNSRYPSNWELSTARASSVLAKLIEHEIAPKRLSAAGYGGFQPIEKNDTAEGRAQNRRVDIVILKPQ